MIPIAARELDVVRVAAAALLPEDPRRFLLQFASHRRRPQPLEHRLASALQRIGGHQRCLNARRRCGVRILIERCVDAARARVVDQLQRVDRSAPVGFADDFVMRDLRRQTALFADLDRLLHAVEDAVRLVAHVGDVDAAHSTGDLGELDHFRRRRERPRHVEEAGAEAEGAVFHAGADHAAHLLDLRLGRLAIHEPDHLAADRALSDEEPEVRRDARRRDPVEERLDRERRGSVGPFDERRDALAHVVVGGGYLEDAAARMRVEVDEPRRDDAAARIDDARRRRVDPRRDARNRVAAHREIASVPRAAGAVDDTCVADEEIEGGRRLRARHDR